MNNELWNEEWAKSAPKAGCVMSSGSARPSLHLTEGRLAELTSEQQRHPWPRLHSLHLVGILMPLHLRLPCGNSILKKGGINPENQRHSP